MEGLPSSGKTTASHQIQMIGALDRTTLIPEYTDFDPVRARVPLPHLSDKEELAALEVFLELDQQRLEPLWRFHRITAILDRSYHSLLAHVFASDRIERRHVFPRAVQMVLRRRSYVPDVVTLLEVSSGVLAARRIAQKSRVPSYFFSNAYEAGFLEYFRSAFVDDSSTLVRVDGEALPAEVAGSIVEALRIRLSP
jgi:thymidylate kinase